MANPTPHILLVDDDPSNLFLLQELLLCEGYVPHLAASGSEALAIAAQSTIDLILLDVMMPKMDGFEVCRRLREDARFQAVPVIFLTALDDDDSRMRGLEMMGDDYLTKPINTKLLLAKIASLLRLREMRSQQLHSEINELVKEQSQQQIAAAWEVNDYISEKFRLFVPEQYLNRIAPQGVESIQLGNAREEEITVLFCDIRGFTAIAESQTAMQTFQWLNAFFTQMSQAITADHGFVDKFLGDAILAVFDRPENHAEDALNAAVMMFQSLSEFNRDRFQYNLEQPVNVGIGIHTGMGLIGTVGSDHRMDSTVIGDVVNTAARLEELTKLYGCSILASHTTIAHLRGSSNKADLEAYSNGNFPPYLSSPLYPSRWIDRVKPRGKRMVLDLYEILGTPTHWLDKAKLQAHCCYNLGLQAWYQEDFARALDYFQQVVEQNPDDTIAALYVERCQARLGMTPPEIGASWDGFIA
ncbi:MAG TPA: response regulator [Candidatus Sericytochromatia bacterium]|jgi:two-component system sensor histidine kinase ChiS